LLVLLLGEDFKKFAYFAFLLLLGLSLTLIAPFIVSGDISQALGQGAGKIALINDGYINSYNQLSFFYWFTKFLIRTLLVALAAFPLWFFAMESLRRFSTDRNHLNKKLRMNLLFLGIWFFSVWMVTTIGKRIFFHYFVFLFPPICLLASYAFCTHQFNRITLTKFGFKKGSYAFLVLLAILSLGTFYTDTILRWSLSHYTFDEAVSYLQKESRPSDRIYVWGLAPQIYFLAEREPASTAIWADSLAGFSTGSPAMEYMRATGATLTLPESVLKDLKGSETVVQTIDPIKYQRIHSLDDKELLSINEILDRIDSFRWRKLFQDFFAHPPVFFLDTSPSNIRQFSSYPLEKYDLLKKFIEDNYIYDRTLDNIIIYKLNAKKGNLSVD
jgi:hypothetical protein